MITTGRLRFFLSVLLGAGALAAQTPSGSVEEPPSRHDSIVVTGTYEPIPLNEAERSIRVFDVRQDALLFNSAADFLRLEPSLDLRSRAPNAVQSDLSIRGGTFGQTLVLLNGMRLNDAQSGHHNMDIPVPVESISRIEILKGAGSTFYGSDAVGGVVNILTREPEATEFRVRTSVGNFGVNQQSGSLALVGSKLTQHLSFSRDFSSGFMPNRDYRNLSLASHTNFTTALGHSNIVLAHNDRPFGAEQFYGNFNSWERTKGWFASMRQGLGEKTEAAFAFRRHTDLFVLYRDRPQAFTNRHAVESYQGSLRRRESLGQNASLHFGVEGLHESIDSNNLGRHSRGRGAGYVALDIRALQRFSFSVGAREEIYRQLPGSAAAGSAKQTLEGQFSPNAAAGVWISQRLKLRGGVSRAFRLPSYTDLYYHDPATLGSPDLRPEYAWNYEAGLDWNMGGALRGDVTVFHRRERDGIDYVRSSPADIWRATNFQSLRFTGVEASVTARAARAHELDFRYTGLYGAQDLLQGIQSRYVFNYPSHSGVASWQARLPHGIIGRTRLGVVQRFARDPYALVDIYVAGTRGRVHPFLQLSNTSNTSYQEIPGVRMPGRSIIGGVELVVYSSRK